MASDDSSPAASLEKQKRGIRRKKSASQLELLEKVYAEDKFPSIAFRAGLTKELGLSEKQLQVWFTHRRRKDRRDGIDVDQLMPHGNNHCNSERQGDDDDEPELLQEMQLHLNSREEDGSCLKDRYPISVVEDDDDDDDVIIIESINGMDRSNAKLEKIQKPKPAIARKEIAPQLKQAGEKQLPFWRSNLEPEVNITNSAKAAHELAAIAAVEMQLRGPMQDDGPPLGFEFDSLPPDAFQEFTGRQGGIYSADRSENLLTGRGSARSSRKSKNLKFRDKKKRKLEYFN